MQCALSIFGKDSPGIISSLTEILSKNGVNIEDASMTLLQGHFAMILVVECDETKFNLVESELSECEALKGFTLGLSQIDPVANGAIVEIGKDSVRYVLHLSVKDTPGVVANVTKVMAQSGANVVDCNTRKNNDTQVFTLSLDVDLPLSKENDIVKQVHEISSEYDGDIVFLRIDNVDL